MSCHLLGALHDFSTVWQAKSRPAFSAGVLLACGFGNFGGLGREKVCRGSRGEVEKLARREGERRGKMVLFQLPHHLASGLSSIPFQNNTCTAGWEQTSYITASEHCRLRADILHKSVREKQVWRYQGPSCMVKNSLSSQMKVLKWVTCGKVPFIRKCACLFPTTFQVKLFPWCV